MSFLVRVAQNVGVGGKFMTKNYLNRSMCAQAQTAASLPSNLHLVSEKVLELEDEKLFFSPEQFMFPPLHTPKSTTVAMFKNPGYFIEETAPLEETIFSVAIRKDIVHEMIRYQRHKVRQPKKTKRMSEISGSNKKPRPQKGTGQAQAGHKRNSVWRGGQKAHGPVLRDYSISLNRKFRAMALMITLTAKFREGNLIVFDNIAMDTHKTKDLSTLLNSHGLGKTSILIVDDIFDQKFLLAVTNLMYVTPLPQHKCNVYDIVKREKMAISMSALKNIQVRLMAQYTHRGKLQALHRDMNTYLLASNAKDGEFDEDDDSDDEAEEAVEQAKA